MRPEKKGPLKCRKEKTIPFSLTPLSLVSPSLFPIPHRSSSMATSCTPCARQSEFLRKKAGSKTKANRWHQSRRRRSFARLLTLSLFSLFPSSTSSTSRPPPSSQPRPGLRRHPQAARSPRPRPHHALRAQRAQAHGTGVQGRGDRRSQRGGAALLRPRRQRRRRQRPAEATATSFGRRQRDSPRDQERALPSRRGLPGVLRRPSGQRGAFHRRDARSSSQGSFGRNPGRRRDLPDGERGAVRAAHRGAEAGLRRDGGGGPRGPTGGAGADDQGVRRRGARGSRQSGEEGVGEGHGRGFQEEQGKRSQPALYEEEEKEGGYKEGSRAAAETAAAERRRRSRRRRRRRRKKWSPLLRKKQMKERRRLLLARGRGGRRGRRERLLPPSPPSLQTEKRNKGHLVI